MRAIYNGTDNRTSDETRYDEDGAADAGFVLGVAVWIQDLVHEAGEGVEEADVDAEGEEDNVEGGGAEHEAEGIYDGGFGDGGGGGGGSGGCGGDEEGGDACYRGDDGDYEDGGGEGT